MARQSRKFTRNQIVEALVTLGAELGRTPSKVELFAKLGLNQGHFEKHFNLYNDALAAAKLPPNIVKGRDADQLLDDWGNLTRELGHLPTLSEYKARGKFSLSAFRRLFESWVGVGKIFYARSAEDRKWHDVIKIIDARMTRRSGQPLVLSNIDAATNFAPPTTATYGKPLNFDFLRHAPVNEAGVVYLFGCLAKQLGYSVEAIQTAFPDCEAKREGKDGRLRRVRIEFEFESRNFELHRHDASGCDVIVCWRHNWEQCPLHVVELSKELEKLQKAA
ncbi:MAG: homing endonuclease associated repeat-containing protein [Phycisphaerales bacterium]